MNILIIDDHEIVREGIEFRVKKVKPQAQCYFAYNARLAQDEMRRNKIDLILCDLEFSGETKIDGFYIIKSIREFEPRVKAIALTNYNSYRIMKKAIDSGFHSFLDKGCSFYEFSKALINVLANGDYESASMKRLLKKRYQFLNTIFSESLYGLADLSERELEITLLASETIDKYEMGDKLCLSPATIDTYIGNALVKLSLKHRKELQLFSLEFKDEILKYQQ